MRYNKKFVNILQKQANVKNNNDCKKILVELNSTSLSGEYTRTIQLKINQAHYMETLGLKVTPIENKFGYYEISWKNE